MLGAATLALSVVVCPIVLLAKEPTPVRSFRLFDKQRSPGLPQSTVMDLLQDDSGLLWLATLDGLGIYDGTAIRPAPEAPNAPLYGNLYSLARRAGGGLWVGGATSVWRFDGSRWTVFPATGAAASLAEDALGRLWRVDQAGGLWLFTGNADESGLWRRITLPDWIGPAVAVHAPARALRRDDEPGVDARTGPRLWLAGRRGVGMLLGGDVSFDPVASGASPAPGSEITAVLPTRSGACWVATDDGRLHHTTSAGWRSVEPPGWDGGRIRTLVEDLSGRVWAGGLAGGVAFGGGDEPWTVWGPENGLRSEGVVTLLADREGTMWISANGYGLQQWVGEGWSHRDAWRGDSESVLRETREPVFGIAPSLDGRGFYAAVFSHGIWHWDGRRMRTYGEDDGLEEDVRSAFEPSPGVLWVAARQGLYERRAGETRFRWAVRVPSGFVYGVVRDPEGGFWAHTSAHGVLRRSEDGSWRPADEVNRHLPDRDVKALLFPAADTDEMWLGTLGGLVILRNGVPLTLPPDTATALPKAVQALHRSETTGDVWVAGFGGLARIPGGDVMEPIEILALADGLPGHTVYSLASGTSASDGPVLWMGGSDGVGRMPLDAPAGERRITVYDSGDGLIEDECNHLGLWSAPDGSVYVGTMASLARFDPGVAAPPPPPLRIRWLERPTPGTELAADRRAVHLSWHAPWLAPAAVEYRTRVPRLSTEWSRPMSRGALDLENLGPGDWTVELQARVSGVANPDDANAGSEDGWVTATTSFSIEPYFHETRAFWLLCAAIALLLVFAVVRWRTRQLRRRAADLQAAVDEALAQIKVLGGLLPICAGCKKVRGDEGYWQQIESYLHTHSEAELSHGLCPDCASELYGAYLDVEASDESERALEAEAS